MNHIIKATVGLNKLSAADKVAKAQALKDTMQASGNFPAGNMPLTYGAIQTLITNLHNAVLTVANNGTPADTNHLHEQERLLLSAFNFIKAHVEFVANNLPDPATVITSAGIQLYTAGGANAVTELTLNALSGGAVQVRVPRLVTEKAFVIETSADGTTWVQTAMSALTKIKLTGLTVATTLYVRYYAISKAGKGTTSQVKTITVV